MSKYKISLSVVTYNTSLENIENIKKSLNYCVQEDLSIYIIDNSPENTLQTYLSDDQYIYIHNPSNPGFGQSHNIAINEAISKGSKYHFVVNPDVYFKEDVITPMVEYMDNNNAEIGMMMPEVLYPNDSIQYLPKLLPNIFWIFRRKIKFPAAAYNRFLAKYELRGVIPKLIYNTPLISGCFTLLNLNVIKEMGSYDDRFFMYFEDFDLSRRIHNKYQTLYFPKVSVFHQYESGANKSYKLFGVFINSMIKYFNKWGWFFDKNRYKINKDCLRQFKGEKSIF